MITIVCSGSRGDYQPYIALAKKLKEQGKDVRITTGKAHEEFVENHGIEAYPISIDLSNAKIDPKILEDAGSSDNPLKMFLTFNKMKNIGYQMLVESYEACTGSELVIYHPGCSVAYFAASEMNIPSVLLSPFPIHKNDDYLSVVMYGKSKNSKNNRKLSYKMLYSMLWMVSKNSIKKLWKEKYKRLPENFKVPFDCHATKRNPSIVSCSGYIFSKSENFNENIHQCGYLFLDENESYTPEKYVEDFLNYGEKPVYIGFGSMLKHEEKQKYARIAINALLKADKRGVLYGFGEVGDLPNTIITVKTTPHSWLFNKMAAVCHHGGAGTSAEGFKAGIPSIIVPFSNDQFAWGYRSFDLGIGVKPIHKKDLNEDNLADALLQIDDTKIQNNAKIICEKIKSEKGLENAAKVVLQSLEV